MNSDTKYAEFVSNQERNMKKRRYQGQPEVKKQKAATDKLRLAKMKTNPEENKKKYDNQVRRVKLFDEIRGEKKTGNGPIVLRLNMGICSRRTHSLRENTNRS